MFLGLSGSIAGGMMCTGSCGIPGGTNSCAVKTAASYDATNSRRNSHTAAFGAEVSIWQRQIQRAPPDAWFVCFAPAENPRLVVAVIVEDAGYGGAVAAPIARDIMEAALPMYKK